MFFLKTCRIVAILALVFGGLQLTHGLLLATEVWSPAPGIYHEPTGRKIDRAVYMILFSFVMGALSEMGLAMVRMERANSKT